MSPKGVESGVMEFILLTQTWVNYTMHSCNIHTISDPTVLTNICTVHILTAATRLYSC